MKHCWSQIGMLSTFVEIPCLPDFYLVVYTEAVCSWMPNQRFVRRWRKVSASCPSRIRCSGTIFEMSLKALDGLASWIRSWSCSEKSSIGELRQSFTIQRVSI